MRSLPTPRRKAIDSARCHLDHRITFPVSHSYFEGESAVSFSRTSRNRALTRRRAALLAPLRASRGWLSPWAEAQLSASAGCGLPCWITEQAHGALLAGAAGARTCSAALLGCPATAAPLGGIAWLGSRRGSHCFAGLSSGDSGSTRSRAVNARSAGAATLRTRGRPEPGPRARLVPAQTGPKSERAAWRRTGATGTARPTAVRGARRVFARAALRGMNGHGGHRQ